MRDEIIKILDNLTEEDLRLVYIAALEKRRKEKEECPRSLLLFPCHLAEDRGQMLPVVRV